MNFSHHHHSEKPEAIEQSIKDIHTSLNLYELDRDHTIIIGGAALALNGIRTASDIDVMIDYKSFQDIIDAGLTTGSAKLTPKPARYRSWLTVLQYPTGLMKLDITSPLRRNAVDRPEVLDEKFFHEMEHMPVSVDGWHYLDLQTLTACLSSTGLRRHKRDIKIIEQHHDHETILS